MLAHPPCWPLKTRNNQLIGLAGLTWLSRSTQIRQTWAETDTLDLQICRSNKQNDLLNRHQLVILYWTISSTSSKLMVKCLSDLNSHYSWDPCSPQEGVERSAPLPGDFRVIVGPIPAQMDDFCDLHGTPDTPVSRIVTVKGFSIKYVRSS